MGVTAALMGAGLALQGVGTFQQAAAASAEAKARQAVANYNAKAQEQEARAIEQRTLYEQSRGAEEAARTGSTMLANMGAAGVVPSEGTPLLIQARQAAESELDNLMIGYEGQVGAGRARSQANMDKLQAKIYGKKASSAATAGYVGAGTTLLAGFGKMKYDKVI